MMACASNNFAWSGRRVYASSMQTGRRVVDPSLPSLPKLRLAAQTYASLDYKPSRRKAEARELSAGRRRSVRA
jgi:hypothetical protein